jgi:hypothetical protein
MIARLPGIVVGIDPIAAVELRGGPCDGQRPEPLPGTLMPGDLAAITVMDHARASATSMSSRGARWSTVPVGASWTIAEPSPATRGARAFASSRSRRDTLLRGRLRRHDQEPRMSDESIAARIERLVAEEHDLRDSATVEGYLQ